MKELKLAPKELKQLKEDASDVVLIGTYNGRALYGLDEGGGIFKGWLGSAWVGSYFVDLQLTGANKAAGMQTMPTGSAAINAVKE